MSAKIAEADEHAALGPAYLQQLDVAGTGEIFIMDAVRIAAESAQYKRRRHERHRRSGTGSAY